MDKFPKEIESFFPFVDKPKGIALSFHKKDCHQCKELREDLEDFKGQQLPPKTIRYIHQELSCLSAEGWCWVLPSNQINCLISFLKWCRDQEAWGGYIPESIEKAIKFLNNFLMKQESNQGKTTVLTFSNKVMHQINR